MPSRVGFGPLGFYPVRGLDQGFQDEFLGFVNPNFLYVSKKKKRRKIEGEFSFLQTHFLGATSHTVYYGRQKSRREERKTERGPARKEEGLLIGFFSLFFLFSFSSLSKSESRFLSREREREREDILCAREKDLVLAIVVKNTFTCRWGARRRIRKPGRSCFRTRARRP
tara:strand:- start:4166 stop:4672 length:507 start_codon:yes stop_codon:yes gene_type:complete